MPLALILLAGLAGLIPARWNSADPKSLALLGEGAVNCILVEPSNWNPSLLGPAKRRRIATFVVIHLGPESLGQARRAMQFKLDGVALDGPSNRLPHLARQ